jgi:hypothetical protein
MLQQWLDCIEVSDERQERPGGRSGGADTMTATRLVGLEWEWLSSVVERN